MRDSTPFESEAFLSWVQQVLASARPRHAIFDLDHTLLDGDIGEQSFLELARSGSLGRERSLLLAPTYLREFAARFGAADLFELYKLACAELRTHTDAVREEELAKLWVWMVRCMSSLRVSEVERASTAALGACKLRSGIAELVATLMHNEFRVWVISASHVWGVRAAVENLLNPLLEGQGLSPISRDQICGVNLQLEECGRLELPDDSQRRLSATVIEPAPIFAGKARLAEALLDARPTLVVGDGVGDIAMAELAHFKLFLPKPGDAVIRPRLAAKRWGESLYVP